MAGLLESHPLDVTLQRGRCTREEGVGSWVPSPHLHAVGCPVETPLLPAGESRVTVSPRSSVLMGDLSDVSYVCQFGGKVGLLPLWSPGGCT